MSRSLPSVIVQAANAQTTSSVFLVLMDISHSAFTAVRLVNNTQNIVSNGNTYTAFPFSIILPADADDLQVRARVIVSNASLELIDEIRGVAGSREKIAVSLTVIEAADPDTALQTISGLVAADMRYNAMTIEADLTIDNFLTEPFPGDSFSPANFPGIF